MQPVKSSTKKNQIENGVVRTSRSCSKSRCFEADDEREVAAVSAKIRSHISWIGLTHQTSHKTKRASQPTVTILINIPSINLLKFFVVQSKKNSISKSRGTLSSAPRHQILTSLFAFSTPSSFCQTGPQGTMYIHTNCLKVNTLATNQAYKYNSLTDQVISFHAPSFRLFQRGYSMPELLC